MSSAKRTPYLCNALKLLMILQNFTQPSSTSYCCTNCSCLSDTGHVVSMDCSELGWYSLPADFPMTLSKLRMSSNTIVNPWTPYLFKLKHIRYLDLSRNKIQRALNLTSLANNNEQLNTLDFLDSQTDQPEMIEWKSSNQTTLGPMKMLIHLDLSGNLIERLGDDSFVLFPNLQVLNVSNNCIKLLEPGAFDGLHSLRILNMYNNSLGMPALAYPLLLFKDLSNLLELNLLGNVKAIQGGETYPDLALSRLMSLNRLLMDGIPHPETPGRGFRNLTKLTYLHFGDSQQQKCFLDVLGKNFFANIISIEPLEVNFQYCVIQEVDPGAFSNLLTLKTLKLISCNMGFDKFAVASQSFHQTQLEYLDITGINRRNLNVLGHDSLKYLSNVSLHTLIIEKNHILNIEQKAIEKLPSSIQRFSIAQNKIVSSDSLFSFIFMINLEVINVSYQNNYRMASRWRSNSNTRSDKAPSEDPAAQTPIQTSIKQSQLLRLQMKVCPSYRMASLRNAIQGEEITYRLFLPFELRSMHKLNMENKMRKYIGSNMPIPLPRKLKQIFATNLKLGYAVPKLQFSNSNVIELADFSKNLLLCLDGPLYGFHRLHYLDLSENYCPALSPYFFKDVPALRKLLLSFNNIGPSLEADKDGETFSKLSSLEYIDVSHNDIRTLHPKVFKQSTNLQTILLNNNALQVFDIDIGNLNKLTLVDLSANALVTLPKRVMTSLDTLAVSSPNLTLDLFDNDLLCDCSHTDLITWYIKTKINFRRKELYKCHYVNGSVLYTEDLINVQEITWRYCVGQQILVPVLTTFLTTLVILTALGFYSYFRVRLLFYIYISKARYFRNFYDQGPARVKDVFLVYDDQEIRWRQFAIKVVKPELESRGVSVYISEVDALAGRPLRMVIEESVLAARKTLVLLTLELFLSEERELEINMAKLSEEMRLTDVLYFIRLQPVLEGSMPCHIHKYLEEKRPIDYRHNDPTFWADIVRIIKSST